MRHRSIAEQARMAAARQAERRLSAAFGRTLKANAVIDRFLEAVRLVYGEQHKIKVTYDADTGWYTVERGRRIEHLHAQDLTLRTDLIYAALHEQELGNEDDK